MIESLRQQPHLWDLYALKDEYANPVYEKRYGKERGDAFEPCTSKYLYDKYMDLQYPEGKSFAVCLTHDVDDLYPPLKHTLLSAAYEMERLDFKGMGEWLFWKSGGKMNSPYWNFDEIMKMEEGYGARSSFYFMATDRDVRRFRYNIEDLSNELGRIVDNGWEIGLHGGYYAYNDLKEIQKEKLRLEKSLGKEVIGYRNHYLRFKVPDTWEYLQKAGFKYDTTIGYGDMIGFRNGMCHPYRPYDLRNEKELDILEIPLAIMDGALFDYFHTFEDALHASMRLIDIAEKYKGVLTLLWHNSMFTAPFRKNWVKIYGKLLEYCRAKNAWMTSGEEIYNWAENLKI